MQKICAMALVSFLFVAVACGDTPEPNQLADECGGWSPDPQTPNAACKVDADCGDPGVCIAPRCYAGACVYENAPPGLSCSQCNVTGFCNGNGTCLDKADWVPSIDCADTDPCTDDAFDADYGCIHTTRPNGWTCNVANGEQGICEGGACVVEKFGAKMAICTEAADECAEGGAYILNDLDGSCFFEWCNLPDAGRAVLPKPAGWPCVMRASPGSPEWAAGQCSPCGTCVQLNV